MAGSEKAKSSSVNQKGKSSFLDEEIGDEFLTSWKSISVMEDDGMDFSFDTVSKGSKGKKKVFDFEKLDMDFNLDGDFGKISYFKMDMPDLDFSSPPRSAAKTKERSEEEPSKGNRQGKQDPFKFSFDFNDGLDDFDLDPSLKKSEGSSNKNKDSRKEVLSDRRGPQGSKIDLAEDISTLDSGSERVDPSKIDTSLLVLRKVNSINDNCPSKSRSENLKLPHGPRSPVKVMIKSVEESDQRSHLSEKELATEPYAKPATDDLSGQLVGGVDSNGGTIFEGENDGCLQTDFNTTSSGKEDVDEKMSAGDGPNSEDLPSKDSSPVNIDSPGSKNGDRCKSGSDISTQNAEPKLGSDISTENTESAIDDIDLEDNSNTFISRKTLLNIKSIKDDQNLTSKLPLSAESSESAVDKVMLTNESKSGEFHSKISKRLEEVGSQMCQPSLIGAKSLSSGSNGIDTMRLRPAIEERVVTNAHDAQIGNKLPDTPVLVDKETKAKHVISGSVPSFVIINGEDLKPDGVPNRAKLVRNSRLSDKEVTEREPVLGSGLRKSLHDPRHVNISSGQANPSNAIEKTIKPSAQTCVNPKSMLSSLESMRNSKIITAEGSKLCPDKPAQKKTDLSTLNISKNIGGSKVSSNASLRSPQQNMEVQRNVESKTAQVVDRSEQQKPPNLSLKRKTFEGSDSGLASLKPLKRLSQSPTECRNFKEPSKEVVAEQVRIHESHVESKTNSTFDDHLSSELGSPCGINVMELDIPSVMENDGNVEKAEVYAKELEDICNVLRKKHEEAKELLVRAIVNNNNLLMLNHPIYEAKIHKVQKFAAKLVFKEPQTCSRSPTIVIQKKLLICNDRIVLCFLFRQRESATQRII